MPPERAPASPTVAFFDCDYTCIDTDCEMEWKAMLVELGVAPASDLDESIRYRDLHDQGLTPVDQYTNFLLRDFAVSERIECAPFFSFPTLNECFTCMRAHTMAHNWPLVPQRHYDI